MRARQAVIIIHGIGEQRPLDTLRGFVRAVTSKPIRNKPDKMSSLFELRRFQMPSSRHTPLTDFYEYYWAYRMRDTRVRMVMRWLWSLLYRLPWKISAKLRPFYYFGWSLVIAMMLAVGWVVVSPDKIAPYVTVVVVMVLHYFSAFLYGYVGDAARYFDAHPDNIEQRNKIRAEGLALLQSLHESRKYNRIVVVGHSLGSVIGYDLLRLYWATLKPSTPVESSKLPLLRRFSSERDALFSSKKSVGEIVELFQQFQFKLWKELREEIKWPWLVTDFITLGSPLAHAEMLLAKSADEFKMRKDEGELLTCPPVFSNAEVFYSKNYGSGVDTVSIDVPTHLVPFACTRWTNIFFPNRWVLFGDMVGGPLKTVFGKGVRDIAVALPGWRNTLFSHVCYWGNDGGNYVVREGHKHPVKALNNTLKLDSHRGKTTLPPA